MKKILLALTLLALASTAQATTIFSDNFDANDLALNSVPTGWTVTDGTVDIIGDPDFYDFIPGSGRYVDLDGSTSQAGILSKTLLLTAGETYTATFDLAGNHRTTDQETVTGILGVGLGNVSNTFSLAQNDGWTSFSLTFTPVVTGSYILSFGNSGGDNIGMLLDNVVVSVPEGGNTTYAMFAAIVGLFGFAARRRLVAVKRS